ncbi:hypothetical protein RND71_010664 [Anisodus tanguticus]|uniref:Uncharacterized protein n=1 Tax=Anisodus tanguticus TaxID=243964 RepID=A0AAE1SI63_9SOLA|nr:hypothetical protein RND71_010664 [Anisodus tanguticus]
MLNFLHFLLYFSYLTMNYNNTIFLLHLSYLQKLHGKEIKLFGTKFNTIFLSLFVGKY